MVVLVCRCLGVFWLMFVVMVVVCSWLYCVIVLLMFFISVMVLCRLVRENGIFFMSIFGL